MVKRKRTFRRPRKGGFVRAVLWVITFLFISAMSASTFSILNNQFAVSFYVWLTLIISTAGAIGLITFRAFTTNETLAFSKK